VSLPVSDTLRTQGIRVCPNCNESWAQLAQGANLEASFQDFAKSLEELKSVLKQVKEYTKGKLAVSLELTPEAFPSVLVSRGKD
jgi:hypothetical protein